MATSSFVVGVRRAVFLAVAFALGRALIGARVYAHRELFRESSVRSWNWLSICRRAGVRSIRCARLRFVEPTSVLSRDGKEPCDLAGLEDSADGVSPGIGRLRRAYTQR